MDPIITAYLSGLQTGALQSFRNMSIAPLFAATNGGPTYVLLKEAMDEALLTVTEIDRSGSVPELKVTNTSDTSVLLLDGEELTGAKQNRVLNTTILLKGKSETVIPVSCTEQGRWSYTTASFSHSNIMMSQTSRASKAGTVTASLRAGRGPSSDQRRVWADAERILEQTGTPSSTRAMKDAYTAKAKDLKAYEQAFPCVARQRGSLVLINGEPAGLDVISRETAYTKLHPRLVRSYAMDALLQRKDEFEAASEARAKAFLREVETCKANTFASVGEGTDHRFEGAQVVGSALVCEDSIVHLAFFRLDESESRDSMSGFSQRRAFRRGNRQVE